MPFSSILSSTRRVLPGGGVILGMALLLAGCGGGQGSSARGLGRLPGLGDHSRNLPATDVSIGLRLDGKPRGWSAGDASAYLDPEYRRVYGFYGLASVGVGEYTYGPDARRLTIETFIMDRPLGAAGAYHWTRTQKLQRAGEPLPRLDGAEGVIDRRRGAGNAYFFKHDVFAKIIVHGNGPSPDLTAAIRAVARAIPTVGRPVRAFEWLDIPGVDLTEVGVTPTPALGHPDLGQAVFAPAPAAGEKAWVYLVEADSRDKAKAMEKAHADYIALNARDAGAIKATKAQRPVWWGIDRKKTPVVATRQGNAVILVTHADSRERAMALLDAIAARVADKD